VRGYEQIHSNLPGDSHQHHRARTTVALMPERTDLQSILILGSGSIVIGQAAEFD
jgi:hypothetical protein